MKIVIAPDSFKECLSALEVATAIELGFKEILPEAQYFKIPMADGGEGTVDSMVDALQGKKIFTQVTSPLGEKIEGFWGISGDQKTAIIEMAAASGLHFVPVEQRNPMNTTSFGTGELILAALDQGVENIILGIGGSATNDGGMGMMQALGARFINQNNENVGINGKDLLGISSINLEYLDARLKNTNITVACDVNNPLCGDYGASAVFGSQKGASPEIIQNLDQALNNYGHLIEQTTGKHVLTAQGAGAAGGMGAALLGLLNATMKPGIEIVMEAVKLHTFLQEADLVITGEGRTDSQTAKGKTPMGVAAQAKKFNKPVICISGGLSHDHAIVHQHGIDAIFSTIYKVAPLEEVLQEAHFSLQITARNIAKVWAMNLDINNIN